MASPRDDIAKIFFRFGKKVEKDVRDGHKIDILRLNYLLLPSLESLETKLSDETKKRKREEECTNKKTEISESALLKTPTKKIRIDNDLASNISRLDGARKYDPLGELDTVDVSNVLKWDIDSDVWNDYMPRVHIDDEGENILCGGDLDDLMNYLDSNSETVEDMLVILKSIKKKKILTFRYFLPGMIQLCELITQKYSEIHAWDSSGSSTEELEEFFNENIEESSDTSNESSEDTQIVIE